MFGNAVGKVVTVAVTAASAVVIVRGPEIAGKAVDLALELGDTAKDALRARRMTETNETTWEGK